MASRMIPIRELFLKDIILKRFSFTFSDGVQYNRHLYLSMLNRFVVDRRYNTLTDTDYVSDDEVRYVSSFEVEFWDNSPYGDGEPDDVKMNRIAANLHILMDTYLSDEDMIKLRVEFQDDTNLTLKSREDVFELINGDPETILGIISYTLYYNMGAWDRDDLSLGG